MSVTSNPTFELTFDRPALRSGQHERDEPLVVLTRCATLGDVHRAFSDIRSILEPYFGPAKAHGTTKTMVQAFGMLLRHPLGPSVAAEALSLAVCSLDLVPSPVVVRFFEECVAVRSSRQTVRFGHRSLYRDRLAEQPSSARRAETMRSWFFRAHFEGCSFSTEIEGHDGTRATWIDLRPIDWLAGAPAALLCDQLPWMSSDVRARVLRHPLLLDGRLDLQDLAPLVVAHTDELAQNGLLEPGFVERFHRLSASAPIEVRDRFARRVVGDQRNRLACPSLDAERDEWDRPEWTMFDAELGWLHEPCDREGWLRWESHAALISAHDRPRSHLPFVAGVLENAADSRGAGLESSADAVRKSDALHGRSFRTDRHWNVQSLRTQREVSDNAAFMGNCTASLHGTPEMCGSVLLALDDGRLRLNAVVHNEGWRDGRWTVGEINSRFNAGDVPAGVREALQVLVDTCGDLVAPTPSTPLCTECAGQSVASGRVCLDCRGDLPRGSREALDVAPPRPHRRGRNRPARGGRRRAVGRR